MSGATGGLVPEADGSHSLQIECRVPAPVSDVWAALTLPDRLERWIGTYTGDPASGVVSFRMTAEGEDVPASDWEIRACEPPSALRLATDVGDQRWLLDLSLDQDSDSTLVRLRQPGLEPATAESVGPGWEYYLDRLAAAVTGGDVGAVDFERDYYPARAGQYAAPPG